MACRRILSALQTCYLELSQTDVINVQVTSELLDSYFEPLPAEEELQLDAVGDRQDMSGSPASKL